MNKSLLASIRSIRRIAFVCVFTLAIHGCSSSSESGLSDVQLSNESASDAINAINVGGSAPGAGAVYLY